MNITIKPKLFSFNSTKRIFVDDKLRYIAKSDSLAFQSQIRVTDNESGFVKSILQYEATFFDDWFNIRLLNEDNLLLKFKRITNFKHEYVGFYNEDKYEMRESNSSLYSIFKNEIEIAYWKDPKEIRFEQQDDFEILSFDEKNIELIISICLMIHRKEDDKRNPS